MFLKNVIINCFILSFSEIRPVFLFAVNCSAQEFCSVGDDSCLILWDARVGSFPAVKVWMNQFLSFCAVLFTINAHILGCTYHISIIIDNFYVRKNKSLLPLFLLRGKRGEYSLLPYSWIQAFLMCGILHICKFISIFYTIPSFVFVVWFC